jgi:hypothetical protein
LPERVRIDATELTEAQLSADGTRVILTMLDDAGRRISLSLPANCLNAVLSAAPRNAELGDVHRLDSWTMRAADGGRDLLLTLRTPEGAAISFTLKPWQVEGMATIATYGNRHRTQPKVVH